MMFDLPAEIRLTDGLLRNSLTFTPFIILALSPSLLHIGNIDSESFHRSMTICQGLERNTYRVVHKLPLFAKVYLIMSSHVLINYRSEM